MKKVLTVALMVLAMIWGLLMCGEAQAGFWLPSGSLLPGTYLLVYDDQDATYEMLALKTMVEMKGIPANVNFQAIKTAVVIKIDEEHNTKKLCDYLNADPVSLGPELFKEDKIGWHQVPLPFQWVLGDAAI
jgi:hypothetical protein